MALFESAPEEVSVSGKGVSRHVRSSAKFRDPLEFPLFPEVPGASVPSDHLARQIIAILSEMDLSFLTRMYAHRGGVPYHPINLLAVVLYDMYSVQVPWDRKKDVNYRFLLDDGKGPYIFGPQGLKSLMGIPGGHQPWKASKQKPNHNLPADTFVVNAKTFKPFVVPDWVEHSVIYHIFPDRFANGDKRNDPANVVAWDGKPTYSNYFGGDIAGVEQHLDYLKGLGISTVFFNPVFKSPSNHRYETADYLKIDPIFGTNEEFFKLTHDLKGLRHCELA